MMLVDVKMCNARVNSIWSATCTMTFKVEGSCAVFSPPSSLSPAESSGKDGNQDDRSRIKLQCPAEIPLVGYRLMHKHRADFLSRFTPVALAHPRAPTRQWGWPLALVGSSARKVI